jgi:hypothetical protein
MAPMVGMMVAAWLLAGCSGTQVAATGTGSAAAATSTPVPGTSAATGASTSTTASVSTAAAQFSLQGTPAASATVGSEYSFQPVTSSAAGAVTYSIQGLPAWAHFDATSGALTGIPAASDEGTTDEITVTADDGSNSASIGPFTILVQAPPIVAAGAAALSWSAPTANEDGTPITGLAGYHIYYGTDPAALTRTVEVAGGQSTTYVIQGLEPGTYYFEVTAYNYSGRESPPSNVANKTI